MAKEYRIKVKGWASERLGTTPEDTMADMLRYDQGVVESVEPTPESGFGRHSFEAIVRSKQYTPDRWASFIIATELLGRV